LIRVQAAASASLYPILLTGPTTAWRALRDASIGPRADASLVYAIARAESAFSGNAVSSAKATGLMQVMPATGAPSRGGWE
jgi:soluble lytic murein transglycosylase-like protein